MDFHVHAQYRFGGEQFQAYRTFVLAFLFEKMRLLMILAHAFCGEFSLAYAAFVRLQAQMPVLVVDQRLFGFEAHVARRTFVRSICAMRLHMNRQIRFDFEAFAANVACKFEVT